MTVRSDRHIPAGKTILTQHWDEGFPMPLPGGNPNKFKVIDLPYYEPDTPGKWRQISQQVAAVAAPQPTCQRCCRMNCIREASPAIRRCAPQPASPPERMATTALVWVSISTGAVIRNVLQQI